MASLANRIDALEEEVKTIKGSVQKVVMDIRETINDMENPFQGELPDVGTIEKKINKRLSDLEEKLQEQIIATVLSEIKDKTGEKLDTDKIKEEILEKVEKELGDIRKEILNLSRRAEIPAHNTGNPDSIRTEIYELTRLLKELRGEHSTAFSPPPPIFSRELPQEHLLNRTPAPAQQKTPEPQKKRTQQKIQQKLDPTLLGNLVQWMDKITEKMGKQEFEDLLNFYEAAGYILPDTKNILLSLSHLSGNIGEIDTFLDLYRLHKTIHPDDASMDSVVLKMLLQQGKESPWLKLIREEQDAARGEKLEARI